jgi:hypothetical protein
MAYYAVDKKGMGKSAVIRTTKELAEKEAKIFYPDIPYTINRITKTEALRRVKSYIKRVSGKIPKAMVDTISLKNILEGK